MIFGVIFTLLGAQILSIGAFAKVFSYSERFDRGTVSLKRVLKRVTLETGFAAGRRAGPDGFCGLCVDYVGLGVEWFWRITCRARRAVLVDVAFLGMQIIFASFFLSMLGISRGTYIGDYDLPR